VPHSSYYALFLGIEGFILALLVILVWLAALPRWLTSGVPSTPQLPPLQVPSADAD